MIRKIAKTVAFAAAVLFVASTFAVAADMTCSAADDKGCTMAKGGDGKEAKVMGAGAKVGDKLDCNDKMECKKK